MKPEVTKYGVFDMQVCVPAAWTDEQIKTFAEEENPCGTEAGWFIRKDVKLLQGAPERVSCEERVGFIHVTLDA